jgi:putative transposase
MIVNEQDQAYTKKEIEEIVKMVRLELYNNGQFCGARAIKEKLEDCDEINPLPSESTIGRILSHHGLTNGRTGYI